MAIDYTLPNPAAAITQGLNLGSVINEARAASREQEDAAIAQRAMDADIQAVLSKGAPAAADYAALTVKYPHFNAQFKQAWDMLNSDQQSGRIGQTSEVYAALSSGNPDVAQDILTRQAEAAENAGDERSARAARAMSEVVSLDPEHAQSATALRLASMMGPDKFTETFTKLDANRRARQLEASELSASESKALKAAADANFAESREATDLQKKGWDILKVQSDIAVAKENQRIAAINAQLEREKNEVERDKLAAKLADAQAKRDDVVRKKTAEAESARGNIDNMLNTVDRVLQLPAGTINDSVGAWDGSWLGGAMDILDQDVQNFKALMENLDAQSFLAQIPQMKGMGALSEGEGKKLARALQSFNTKQSEQQFIANLKEAQRVMMKARANLATRYGIPDTVPDTPASEPNPGEIDELVQRYRGAQ